MNKITTANFIAKIESTLEDDIQALENVIGIQEDGERKDFLESLAYAKKQILDQLPLGHDFTGSGVNTPSKKKLLSYLGEETKLDNADEMITQMCFEVEKSQQSFLQNQLNLDGIPEELREDMQSCLEIYHTIVHHIDRSDSTQQLGRIVL